MHSPKIKNIIFDLGGVLINLDQARTFQSFADLGDISLEALYKLVESSPLFDAYEKGLVSTPNFMNGVRQVLNDELSDKAIVKAWNAMLLDIPTFRLKFIERLKEDYQLVVLSNTNALHVEAFSKTMEAGYGLKNYHELFDRIYYSHVVNMQKPDLEIFLHVLKESNMKPEETLYLEDNLDNIEAAKQLGIITYTVPVNNLDLDFLKNEFLQKA